MDLYTPITVAAVCYSTCVKKELTRAMGTKLGLLSPTYIHTTFRQHLTLLSSLTK
jgi:hypothetical protein